MKIIQFVKASFIFIFLFDFSIQNALGQKVGAIDDQLVYYIDSDSNLYVMSGSYKYYDLSESRYRQMDKPIKVPIDDKVLKVVAVTHSSNNLYVLGASGNIWNLRYESYREVDNSKNSPALIDGSGTNIDIFEEGIVLKKDQSYYVMDYLSQEEIIIYDIITSGLDLTLKQKSKVKQAINSWVGTMRQFDQRPFPSYFSNNMIESDFNSGFEYISKLDIPGILTAVEAQKSKLKLFFNNRFVLNDKPVDQKFISSVCSKYFKSNPQIYRILFTELGLKSFDFIKSGRSLKAHGKLLVTIKADSTLGLTTITRNYYMVESITNQTVSSDLKWQKLAEGDGSPIAVAFDGTLIQLDDKNINKILFKPSDKSPSNKPYWKQYVSTYISAKGFINYGIKYDGSIWYMGRTDLDLIKHLKFTQDSILNKIDKGNNWTALTITEYVAIGLKTDGKMYGWGYSNPPSYNIMQDPNLSSTYSAVGIVKDVNFKQFSFNDWHVLALSDKDELHYWGRGETTALTRTIFKKRNTVPQSIFTTYKDKTVNLTYLKTGLFKESFIEPTTNYMFDSNRFSEVQSNSNNNPNQARIRFNDIDTILIKGVFKNQNLIQGKKLELFRFADKYNNVSYYYGELSPGIVNYTDKWGIFKERTELLPNGYGILFTQGSIYEGYFKNAMLSGFGIVNIGDEYDKVYQVSYIGEFKEGMLNGFAKKVWPDGSYYEGQWNENELINGTASFTGEFTYSGEISYRGERLTHKSDRFEKKSLLNLDGKGKLFTINGDTLIGNFRNGEISGQGTFLTSGYTYDGNLEKGLFAGYGVQKYRNGSIYSGEWVNGKKEGVFNETSPSGISKKSIWSNNVLLLDESSPKFNLISGLPKTMLKLYLLDQGKFLSSLTGGQIYGGKSATSGGVNAALSGILNVSTSGMSVCDIKAVAGNYSYNTINCVDLVSFQHTNGYVYLEFSGYISKRNRDYSVQQKINSQGKIERNIVEGGSSYERKTLNLTIKVNSNGQVYSFSMCFLSEGGYPDCGMGDYSGTLSKK